MRYRIELSFNSIMAVQEGLVLPFWEVHDTETGDIQYCQTKQEAEEYIDAQENFHA